MGEQGSFAGLAWERLVWTSLGAHQKNAAPTDV